MFVTGGLEMLDFKDRPEGMRQNVQEYYFICCFKHHRTGDIFKFTNIPTSIQICRRVVINISGA